MNRTFLLVSALGATLTTAAVAQTAAPATPPSQPAAPAAVTPQAIPAKIALISFDQAVIMTNEGQKVTQDLQKKYEPKKSQLDGLAQEVDTLKKQLQSAPATLSDDERAKRLKDIDVKEKQYNREVEDAQTALNADQQEVYGKIANKVSATLKDYVSKNGYTILLDVGNQQSNVMWALPSTDITQAVVAAYNTSSGVAAPAATPASAAPAAARPHAAPAAPHTTPKQ